MDFTVGSLLPKVKIFRKDLEEDRCNFAIMEAVRKICRQTGYAQEPLIVTATPNNPTIDLSQFIDCNKAVYRVHLIRLWDTNLNAWKNIYEYNPTLVDTREAYRNYAVGWPTGWDYRGNSQLSIYPTPDIAYKFEVTVSYIPVGEFDVIPLPYEAEEAIIAGTLANLLMQPGIGQNLQFAKDREVLYNREIDFLKANALLGQSGRPRATGKTLATRAIRMWDNRWQ